MDSLVSLFNSMSTFMGYLMTKKSLLKNSSGTIKLLTEKKNWFYNFPKDISLKKKRNSITGCRN